RSCSPLAPVGVSVLLRGVLGARGAPPPPAGPPAPPLTEATPRRGFVSDTRRLHASLRACSRSRPSSAPSAGRRWARWKACFANTPEEKREGGVCRTQTRGGGLLRLAAGPGDPRGGGAPPGLPTPPSTTRTPQRAPAANKT